jgi:hypothetical protein
MRGARCVPQLALLLLALLLTLACREGQGTLVPRRASRWLQREPKPTIRPTLQPTSPTAPGSATPTTPGSSAPTVPDSTTPTVPRETPEPAASSSPATAPVAPIALQGDNEVEVSRTGNRLSMALGLLGILGASAALALAYRRHRVERAVTHDPLAKPKHVSASEFLSGAVVDSDVIASKPREASNPLRKTASSVF